MIIAIAAENGEVCPHFGSSPSFILFDVENGQVLSSRTVENPGHRPGFIPRFLQEQGVDWVIAGGMGGRAVQLFEQFGIRVTTGVSGGVEGAANQAAQGALQQGVEPCAGHNHNGCSGEHNH